MFWIILSRVLTMYNAYIYLPSQSMLFSKQFFYYFELSYLLTVYTHTQRERELLLQLIVIHVMDIGCSQSQKSLVKNMWSPLIKVYCASNQTDNMCVRTRVHSIHNYKIWIVYTFAYLLCDVCVCMYCTILHSIACDWKIKCRQSNATIIRFLPINFQFFFDSFTCVFQHSCNIYMYALHSHDVYWIEMDWCSMLLPWIFP